MPSPINTAADLARGDPSAAVRNRRWTTSALPPAGRLPALTGIRGVAACWVVGFHAATNLGPALGDFLGRDTIILRSGFLAVDLFFMLSGFVLAYSYFPRFETDPGVAMREFVIGRVFRILPLNWAMLALLLLLSAALPSRVWSNEPLTSASFLASMALIQAWGLSSATSWNFPAWSLSAEWAAYVLFPFLLLAGKRVNRASLALAAGAAALVVLIVIMMSVGGGTLEHSWLLGLPRCFLQFIVGMCLWRAFDLGLFDRRYADAILLVGFIGLGLVILIVQAELLAPFAFAAVIIACAMGSTIAKALFANRTALLLGEISFSIYLSHAIIISSSMLAAQSLGLSAASLMVRAVFLLLVGATILGVSFICWRAIERPAQKAGRALHRQLGHRRASAA